jgi:hypothetical protein
MSLDEFVLCGFGRVLIALREINFINLRKKTRRQWKNDLLIDHTHEIRLIGCSQLPPPSFPSSLPPKSCPFDRFA